MDSSSTALSEQQISSFFINGYLKVNLELDCEAHNTVYLQTDRLFQTLQPKANPHNNIVPMVPKLHDVLNDANLITALTSLVGQNYLIHPHRHCHTNFPKREASGLRMLQAFHKDGHAHKPRPRHREPRWLIVFYIPQDTPLHRGPTAVLPGSHLLSGLTKQEISNRLPTLSRSENGIETESAYHLRTVTPLTGGPCAVVCHFDLGHGAMFNSSVLPRYIHKFVVMRTEEPKGDVELPQLTTDDPLQAHLWRWFGRSCELKVDDELNLKSWFEKLQSDNLAEATRALYISNVVAEQNYSYVRDRLVSLIHHQLTSYATNEVLNIADAVNGLVQIGEKATLLELLQSDNPALVATAAYGLGQLRDVDALPPLRTLLHHANPGVVRHAISALGIVTSATQDQIGTTLQALTHKYVDEDDWDVRLFIIQAVIRMGLNDDALPLLCRATNDENAYVSSFALEQLCRFDSEIARKAVIEPLRRQRWFPDPFFVI